MSRGLFRERYLGGQSFEQALFGNWDKLQHIGFANAWCCKRLPKCWYCIESGRIDPGQSRFIISCTIVFDPYGFDGRLEELANAMEAVLSGENIDTAETMLAAVNQHALAAIQKKPSVVPRWLCVCCDG